MNYYDTDYDGNVNPEDNIDAGHLDELQM